MLLWFGCVRLRSGAGSADGLGGRHVLNFARARLATGRGGGLGHTANEYINEAFLYSDAARVEVADVKKCSAAGVGELWEGIGGRSDLLEELDISDQFFITHVITGKSCVGVCACKSTKNNGI